MKIIYFLAVLLLFFGCAKEETPEIAAQAAKKYAVKFKVSGFSQEIAPFEKRAFISADTVDEYAEVIYYFVYDSHGNFIHSLMQEIEDPNFGTITDSLAQGSYTIAVVATQKHYLFGSSIQPSFEDFRGSLSNAQIRLGGVASTFTPRDFFFTKLNLTIDTENVTQSLTLDRIAGKLEIDILDHVSGYRYLFNISEALYFQLGSGETVGGSEQNKESTTGNSCMLTLNTDNPTRLTIYAYDNSNKLIAEKTVNNIHVDRNKRTIVKGNMFEEEPEPANESFSIQINGTWSADSTIVNF